MQSTVRRCIAVEVVTAGGRQVSVRIMYNSLRRKQSRLQLLFWPWHVTGFHNITLNIRGVDD